jgi:hypothetical protein
LSQDACGVSRSCRSAERSGCELGALGGYGRHALGTTRATLVRDDACHLGAKLGGALRIGSGGLRRRRTIMPMAVVGDPVPVVGGIVFPRGRSSCRLRLRLRHSTDRLRRTYLKRRRPVVPMVVSGIPMAVVDRIVVPSRGIRLSQGPGRAGLECRGSGRALLAQGAGQDQQNRHRHRRGSEDWPKVSNRTPGGRLGWRLAVAALLELLSAAAGAGVVAPRALRVLR